MRLKHLVMNNDKLSTRREFIRNSMRFGLILALGGIGGLALRNTTQGKWVWQINPAKCTFCGRCATHCVLNPSAVKCVHVYSMCGYCDLCGGYLKVGHVARNTGAENQLCPTDAIVRRFIEEPYYEYKIIEELCIGCAKCVEGCNSFGNGSFHLQIRHNLCTDCNECAIARVCPSDAISRIPAERAYLLRGKKIDG